MRYRRCCCLATLVIWGWISVVVTGSCTEADAIPPANASVIFIVESVYVLYQCDYGYKFKGRQMQDGVQWCNLLILEWEGDPGVCEVNFCEPNPCYNNGRCTMSEDPWGYGYYCFCPPQNGVRIGGRHCQIVDPCGTRPCPEGTAYCYATYTSDKGRYCFTKGWLLVPEADDHLIT